jgi:hypothetical protein
MESYQLWFAVRYVHVVSVALLTGGALVVAALWTVPDVLASEAALAAASAYEWTFWSVVGIAAATGVSNLGLKGEGLLGPATGWGAALSVKLVTVVALLALGLVRSDTVVRARALARPSGSRLRIVLGVAYSLTALLFLLALWLGLGLAHGRY